MQGFALGFGVSGSGFRVQCLGFRVQGFGVRGSGLRVPGFRVQGFRFRVWRDLRDVDLATNLLLELTDGRARPVGLGFRV